jgi:hypothetical protein
VCIGRNAGVCACSTPSAGMCLCVLVAMPGCACAGLCACCTVVLALLRYVCAILGCWVVVRQSFGILPCVLCKRGAELCVYIL